MSEASFASLSPTLLARKGGAKPAMRPQLAPIPDASQANLEDLGWNDMGHDSDERPVEPGPGAQVVPIMPLSDMPSVRAPSPVYQKRAVLASRFEQDNGLSRAPVERRAAAEQGKRAAFTLRLDEERHLKLRLAATMKSCSAQQLVTDALDALLAEIAELDALAARMKRK